MEEDSEPPSPAAIKPRLSQAGSLLPVTAKAAGGSREHVEYSVITEVTRSSLLLERAVPRGAPKLLL